MQVINVTDATFETEVLNATEPVLVDFWAPWCGPCRMMAPVLEKYAAEQNGRIRVAKLNVDENRRTSNQYGIMSIPTMILFRGGKPAGELIGYMSLADLRDQVEAVLTNKV